MRKLLFLDFDGVCNHNDWWQTPRQPGRAVHPEPAAAINAIAEYADEVVIISAWARWMFQHRLPPWAFAEMIFAHGLIIAHEKIRHFGKRADDPQSRWSEIATYIGQQANPFGFCVVDDCDMTPYVGTHANRFLRIDQRTMLRPWNVQQICLIMSSPVPQQ
jgi:hypothetical protein